MASSFLRRSNPYNPRYSMPGYVLTEPSRRARVSPGLPRGWGGGPNVIVNRGLPRGTVDFQLPPDLAGTGSLSGTTLDISSSAAGRDPIAAFGQQAARQIVAQTGNNVARMRDALSRVGTGLVSSFDSKIRGGMRPQAALAAVLSNRLLSRAASGQAGLGDLPPPPGVTSTFTASGAGRVVNSYAGDSSGAQTPVWSAQAKAIIGPYLSANSGALASPGTYNGGRINMSDKKAFFVRPVRLSSADAAAYNNRSNPSVNPGQWAQVKAGSYFFYASGGLLKFYDPATQTLQIKSEGSNLFEFAGAALAAGVNTLVALPGQIANLACQAVNSPLAQTAVIIGAGAPGAAGVSQAQSRCSSGGGMPVPPQESNGNMGLILALAAGAAVLLIGSRR